MSTPSKHEPECDELVERTDVWSCFCALVKDIREQGREEMRQRVRELHKPKQLSLLWTGCEICWEHPNTRGTSYPCPTIKALDGEEDEYTK